MSFWTAIVAIVALGVFSDIVQKAIKTKKSVAANEDALAAKNAQITELEQRVTKLNAENASLKVALEEQRILADEAVSTFGSRLDRLKGERPQGSAETPEGVPES